METQAEKSAKFLSDEKIALAKELGLHNCADTMRRMRDDIKQLTSLRFKPITTQEIDKMISKRIFKFMYHEDSRSGCYISLAIGATVSAVSGICLYGNAQFLPVLLFSLGATFGVATICGLCASFPKLERNTMRLGEWAQPLPKGALLAVKEAIDAGLENFIIHYPTLESQRVMTDPVITAKTKGGTLLQVHAWDDGKVYE